MAAYHGRRAPNVSQYVANLNTVPSPHELASQQSELSLGDEGLDFLTNAEFFDFDALNVDFHTPTTERPGGGNVAQAYQFNAAYPPSMTGSPSSVQSYPHHFSAPQAVQSSSSQAQAPPRLSVYTPLQQQQQQQQQQPPQQPQAQPQAGEKRPAAVAALPSSIELEDESRMVAEEDKRRRNTAASARFRVKKKQREQALEKQAKEMTDKVQMLEGKVQQLEMENKWLKGLITDKHDGKTLDYMRKTADTDGERSLEDRKDGVGTDVDVDGEEDAESAEEDEREDVGLFKSEA